MKPEQSSQANQLQKQAQTRQSKLPNNVIFEELLQREVAQQQEVKLSAHATKRLQERNISFNQEDLTKINQAVQQAAAKGAKDSLLLYRDLALVTSITNRTVITAIDGKSMADHVFTNIDSAVIIK
ncbi:TIGR02530 family flagellar biosynthesis protein [Desulforamulus aeronauticus]|uniref:TIGR02530 family flagellar biosynthesis protein n=1 Tax=Desulforamulus aeronauticus TaxID=53343 RepID=UPI000934AC1C|nr:TIGR02530 family flagellar biosynthesis protein [Desulforamulus aeronauticus]